MPTKQPLLSPSPADEMYVLLKDYAASVDGVDYCVPGDFRYDGASIPEPAWTAIYSPFHPDVMAGALVHDWLYYCHPVTRDIADDVLYELLKANGVASWKRNAVYQAVHTFGGAHWDNDSSDVDYLKTLYEQVKSRTGLSHAQLVKQYGFPNNIATLKPVVPKKPKPRHGPR